VTKVINSEAIIDHYAKRLNKAKWEVTFRTENGIQVRKLKQMNRLGFWVGLILLPFWGIGLILWLLVLIDYALQHQKIIFVTTNQMIEQLKKEAK